MKRVALLTVSSVLLILVVAGCGMNNSKTITQGPGQLMVTMGDAPNDRVIAFALTVNTMTLAGGANPTVISTPTQIEFVRDAGTFQPLVTAKIDAGTYTGATITVSNPQVVAIDTTTHLPVQLTAALSTATVNVTFNNPLMISASMVEADFDLDLANSVTISGNTATINPVFHVSTKIVRDQDNDDFKDVRGFVTNVTAPNFSIASQAMDQFFTFSTDSNTVFEGISGLSQLTAGMIVEVDAQLQSDGTLLAKRVDVDEDSDDGVAVEGFITSITGSPATQFMLNNEFDSVPIAPLLNLLGIGTGITVDITSNTSFSVSDTDEINTGGLSLSFDASDIGKVQRVEASVLHQTSLQQSGLVLTADRVRLLQQSLNGTVSNVSGSMPETFTLTMASDSAFALLSGQTTVTVDVVSSTSQDMPVANGGAVRVRGLLFFNGSTQKYTLVASQIAQQ
ncbi:MAG TPA: DUF5666 domain-containing protein [Candidatus Angelobacter sp.]